MQMKAIAVVALVGVAGQAHAGLMSTHNLVVLQNFSSNSDVEGRTFIGGNFSSPNASNYGTQLTPAANWLGVDVLSVAGNMTIGNQIQLQAGNLRRGGTRTGNVNFNGGGTEIVDPTLPSQVAAIVSELTLTSAALQALAPDSVLNLPSPQPGPAQFVANPGGDGIAVFSINGDNLFENGLVQQIELAANGATSIVINVSGVDIDWNGGNMVGQFLNQGVRATTIWNFFEAQTIDLNRNFNGAILAPFAHLVNSTSIDGSVFVESMAASGEVHLPNYSGYIPAPGTGVLAVGGLLTAGRRRRR